MLVGWTFLSDRDGQDRLSYKHSNLILRRGCPRKSEKSPTRFAQAAFLQPVQRALSSFAQGRLRGAVGQVVEDFSRGRAADLSQQQHDAAQTGFFLLQRQ